MGMLEPPRQSSLQFVARRLCASTDKDKTKSSIVILKIMMKMKKINSEEYLIRLEVFSFALSNGLISKSKIIKWADKILI